MLHYLKFLTGMHGSLVRTLLKLITGIQVDFKIVSLFSRLGKCEPSIPRMIKDKAEMTCNSILLGES